MAKPLEELAWYEVARELVETWGVSSQTVRGWHERQRYAILDRYRSSKKARRRYRPVHATRTIGGMIVVTLCRQR